MRAKILTLLLTLVMASPFPALAHSKAKNNEPEIGALVESGHTDLTIHFSKKVRVTSFTTHLLAEDQNPSDDKIDLTSATQIKPTEKLNRSFSKELNVVFPPLVTGTYYYHWVAIARDGHKLKGMGHFSVSD